MAVVAPASELMPTVRMPDGGLEVLVAALHHRGFLVVAPVARHGVVTLDAIESAAEISTGWTDRQEPGHYRAESGDGRRRFAHAAPSQPWKRWLHPERTLLVRTRTGSDGLEIDSGADTPATPLAFVGIQSCDLAAIGKLDDVLGTDESYQRRRTDLVTIAVACTTPASTCFCVSAGTGPRPGTLADIALNELDDGTLLARANTATGTALLDEIEAISPAAPEVVEAADALIDAGAATQTRHLDPGAIAAAAAAPDDPGWAAVAARCLTCGNCTLQCPTCFCTSTEDVNLLGGEGFERWQREDSCFSLDFSYVHGGSVRTSATSRYRQWYLHKLVTWHDQFGSSGCVGCGRCITWCPTGIDITEAVIP